MNEIIALALRLLFVILTYLFVGWIGLIIFKDLKSTTSKRKSPVIPPIELSALFNDTRVEHRFTRPEVILGRDPACDFPLDDEMISLRHCRLSFHHHQWWAEDLDSTNGSYLGGVLLKNPTVLTNDDTLRLGQIDINIIIN